MFGLSKKIRGQWRYLTYAGRFSPLAADCWAMDSSTARKVRQRHKDCEIVLILANGSKQRAARAGFCDLSALAFLAGISAMAYAIFSTVFSFGTILQF